MTRKDIIEQIKKEILGNPKFGFEEERLWGEFQNQYFSRSGEINGEKYSSELNRVLSGAAMSHTLSEIRKRLDVLGEVEV